SCIRSALPFLRAHDPRKSTCFQGRQHGCARAATICNMKLYYSPAACSLSPHIVLREAGLAFEPVLAPTKTHQLQDGTDYYTINPLAYVPMPELDDGTLLRAGPVIGQDI